MTIDQIIKDKIADRLKFFLLPGQTLPESVIITVDYKESSATIRIPVKDIAPTEKDGELDGYRV